MTRRKLTNTEYVEYLRVHCPEYLSNDEYKTNKTKISHTHLTCGYTWLVSPDVIKRGHGCTKCGAEKSIKARTKTHAWYVSYLSKHRPDYIVNEEYKSDKTKISHTHTVCGHTWSIAPVKVKAGQCPVCGAAKTTLSKTITNQQYVDFLEQHRSNYTVNEEYKGTKTKISHTHTVCGHTWLIRPGDLKSKDRCPNCNGAHGIDSNSPITLYILTFDSFIKFGISNDLSKRKKDHFRNGEYQVHFTKLFERGQEGIDWERKIKQHFGYAKGAVPKEMCPDGYTETLPLFLIDELDELVNQIL